jgi:hypothetical protein
MWLLIENDPIKLLHEFNNSENIEFKLKIVDRLIELNAVNGVKNLLAKGFDQQVIQKLLETFQNLPKDLFKLLGFKDTYDKTIIQFLIEIGAQDELAAALKSNIDLRLHHIIFEYFLLEPKKLWNLICEYFSGIPYDTKIISYKLDILAVLTEIIDMRKARACISEIFEIIWQECSEDKNEIKLFVLYCICKNKYLEKIDEIEKDKIITTDINKMIKSIKMKYIDEIKKSTNKKEIELILENQRKEIATILDIKDIEPIFNSSGRRLNIYSNFYKNSKLTKNKINKLPKIYDLDIVNDKEKFKRMIEVETDNQIIYLTDVDEIMKCKHKQQKIIDNIVSEDEFIILIESLISNTEDIEEVRRIIKNLENKGLKYYSKKKIFNFIDSKYPQLSKLFIKTFFSSEIEMMKGGYLNYYTNPSSFVEIIYGVISSEQKSNKYNILEEPILRIESANSKIFIFSKDSFFVFSRYFNCVVKSNLVHNYLIHSDKF